MTASAIYEGWVVHRRFEPLREMRHPLWMTLLDVDELPELFDRHPLWSARRAAPVSIRERDFLPGDGRLADRARRIAASEIGVDGTGAVRVLGCPRLFGLGFNPATFTYLHEPEGCPTAVIVEVTNTPWGERHRYVAPWSPGAPAACASFAKCMHVSPFMAMEQTYVLEAGVPGERLEIAVASHQQGKQVFEARLELSRRELTRNEMTRMLLQVRSSGAATLARIYSSALRMWFEGFPRYPHRSERALRQKAPE